MCGVRWTGGNRLGSADVRPYVTVRWSAVKAITAVTTVSDGGWMGVTYSVVGSHITTSGQPSANLSDLVIILANMVR